MYIHSWMVCHRPKSQTELQTESQAEPQTKPPRYGDRSLGGQRPTPVKNAA